MFFDEFLKAEYQKVIDKKVIFPDFLIAAQKEALRRIKQELNANSTPEDIKAVFRRYSNIWKKAKREIIGRWDFPVNYIDNIYYELMHIENEHIAKNQGLPAK